MFNWSVSSELTVQYFEMTLVIEGCNDELLFAFLCFYSQNATKAIKSEPSIKVPVEEPPFTHSEPDEPVSPTTIPSPSREKPKKKAPKAPKVPKLPKPSKVKDAEKKKAKKTKELSPPPKPSSFAALESHAKEILSKMDQQKKPKVRTFIIRQK